MTDLPPSNPFQPQQPISSPELFFGREGAVAFIRERLVTGNNPRAVAILGSHRIGKTSLLFQLPSRLEPRYVFAYIDLAVIDYEEPSALIFAMIDSVRQALEVAGISTYRLPPLPDELDSLWSWFSIEYLEVVLSALRKLRRLLFLFDNTSALLDAIDRHELPAEIGQRFADLMVAENRLDLIFAVDVVDEYRLESFLPLSDPMLHRRLGMLDEAASLALTRLSVANVYQIEDEAAVGVYSVTGGHPYLLQVVNSLLWEQSAARDHKTAVTLNDVQGVIRQAVDITEPTLKEVWEDCTPNEKSILTALTDLTDQSSGQPVRAEDLRTWLLRETNEALDETAISSTLRRLEYREVVRTVDDGETFAAGLQYQWLRHQLGREDALPAPLPVNRPPLRRLAIPLVLLIAVAAAAALLLGRALSTSAETPTPSVAQTVTFAVNVQETDQALGVTQTFVALPTNTPTFTLTSTATATPTDTSTSTLTITATNTASLTLTNTLTPSLAATATTIVTATLSTGTVTQPTLTLTPEDTITPLPPTALPILATNEPPTATITASYTPSTAPTTAVAATYTYTPSMTFTPSFTTTATFTSTPTATSTLTPTLTATATASRTPTATASITPTRTRTPLPTNTRRPTITPPPFPTAQIVATGRP